MTSSGKGFSDWMVDAAKTNPEGALLLAAGAVLLLRRTGAATAVADTGIARRSSEAVRSAAESAKEFASDIAGKTTGMVGETSSAVTDRTTKMAETAFSSVQSSIEKMVREQPLLIAVAGIAAGAAVAAVFPNSDLEKRVLEPVSEKVSDAVRYVGDEAREALGRAGDKLKEVAEEKGLNREGLKGMAGDVLAAAAPQARADKESL